VALTTIPLPYGLRGIALTPFTDVGATTMGTPIDLPYARTLSFGEVEDFDNLRGDDSLVAVHGQGPTLEWELESGGISLDAVKVFMGGSVTTTGSAPNQIKTYKKDIADVRPYFKAEGQAISDSGGDLHGVLYRCRMTDKLDGEFGDGVFYLTKGKGIGLGSLVPATLGDLYDFVQNETTVALPA
jgi:hypothetical protein